MNMCEECENDYSELLRQAHDACKTRDPADLPMDTIPPRDPEMPPGMP